MPTVPSLRGTQTRPSHYENDVMRDKQCEEEEKAAVAKETAGADDAHDTAAPTTTVDQVPEMTAQPRKKRKKTRRKGDAFRQSTTDPYQPSKASYAQAEEDSDSDMSTDDNRNSDMDDMCSSDEPSATNSDI